MKFKSDIEVQAGLRDGGNDIGTAGQILSSTGSQTNWIDQSSIVASESKLVVIECKNTSGVTISKGTPVYQTGTVGATDVIEIDAADASDEDKMAAIGLLQTDLVNNAFGKVVITGELLNITTSPIDGVTPVTGDTIYVKSGGGLTLTKPTGVNFIQNIGLVGKVSGGNSGSITVSSIMRSNDVPTPLYIDHTNQRLGIGTTTPGAKLDISSTGTGDSMIIRNDDASSSAAPVLMLLRDSASAADGDYLGQIKFKGNSDTGAERVYAKITAKISDATNGAEDSLIETAVKGGGSNLIVSRQTGTDLKLINGIGLQVDGNVGIGTTSPGVKLVVNGGGDNEIAKFVSTDSVSQISISDDTTTSYFGSKDGLSFISQTGGTPGSGLVLDSAGNVGIGTTSPGQKLDVNGSVNIDGTLFVNTTNNHIRLVDTDNTGNFSVGVNTNFQIRDITANTTPLTIRAGTPGNTILTTSSGRVGIGLSSPGVTLHVNGFARLNGGLQMNTANATIYQILDSALRFGTNNTERMRITSTGNVGIGTTNPNFKLHVDGGSAMFDTDTGNNPLYIARNSSTSEALKIYVDDTEAFFESIQDETGGDHGRFAFKMDGDSPNAYTRWLHGSTERMRLTAAGNLGIGITSPLQPLSIENSSSPLIKIRNTTNGGGAAIEFNDNGINQQSGRITYYHADSQSQGGGSSFWLTGEDDQALVLANNGRMVVQKSGSTTEVGYGFYDDINTGMYRVSADALGFATGGTRRLDMNSSGVRIGTGSRVSTILDQDNMSSNSNTALATQQSIKAYVDNSVAAIITPAAPSTVTSTIVGETIEIAFNQSTTSDIDYYQVWSSDDGGDYGIIGQITSDDFSATMTVVDTTFVTGGTMSYRVYAVRQGVYSSAATTSKSYTVSALSVTNMTVVNLNTAYYIQYEKPNSRFIDHIEIWMDSQTTQAALNRTNATLVYSGQNHSYMRNVNTSNNFHQFWVEIVTS